MNKPLPVEKPETRQMNHFGGGWLLPVSFRAAGAAWPRGEGQPFLNKFKRQK